MREKTSRNDAISAKKTLDLLQEMLWAIQSRPTSDIKAGLKYLEDSLSTESTSRNSKKTKDREHLLSLVGSMPLILADLELFPSNEHIAKFSSEALGIQISRWEKRSRYEMIGMLVMETINLSESRIRDLSLFLADISIGGKRLASIKKQAHGIGFSWNEAIRSLSSKAD